MTRPDDLPLVSVVVDPALRRPAEVELLQGDSSKARTALGWKPTISFHDLIEMMVKADLERYRVGVGANPGSAILATCTEDRDDRL